MSCIGAAVVVAVGCGEALVQQDPAGPSGCTPLTCELACEHGFVEDASGCAICECKEPPDCNPVDCNLYCEFGYATDDEGCPTCACLPGACPTPSPAGCVMNGCPSDSVCDTTQGCTSSECVCDENTGEWSCTNDCGGGICVPAGGACAGPNPQGCVSDGCEPNEICDTTLGCVSSSCTCDASTGSWVCDPDCGGGVCVPDPAGCGPNPAGCVNTGCPGGLECVQASGVCIPSTCICDPDTGTWGCTDDCGGGICVDDA